MLSKDMKHHFSEKITLESLIEYIEGSTGDPAAQTIERWLKDDPDNQKFYDQIKEIWLNKEDLGEISKATIERDFKNVLNKIEVRQTYGNNRSGLFGKILSMRFLIRAASVILIVASIGTAYLVGKTGSTTLGEDKNVFNEMIVPIGQRSQIILSDGTTVWVNAGSKFRFPSQFTGNTREVWLDGEGLFSVAKDTSKLFYVHTSSLDIKVHGTIFNLKAYSAEDIIETTVVEGLVSFEVTDSRAARSEDVYLKPNHKAIYLKKEYAVVTDEVKREVKLPLEPLKIIISEPVKVEPAISWAEGKMIFTDESLGNIIKKLERRYDVQITVKDEGINHLKYTGVLKQVSIEQALRALQLTTGINYTITENIITISEKKSRI